LRTAQNNTQSAEVSRMSMLRTGLLAASLVITGFTQTSFAENDSAALAGVIAARFSRV